MKEREQESDNAQRQGKIKSRDNAGAVEQEAGKRRGNGSQKIYGEDAAQQGRTQIKRRRGEIEIHVGESANQHKKNHESHDKVGQQSGIAYMAKRLFGCAA